MNPFWVIQSYAPRAQALVPLAARQLERKGYLVQIAHEGEESWFVRALVVLAVRPRWRWWLELVRWVSSRCWFGRHQWVLIRSFPRIDQSVRFLWRCTRCRVRKTTRHYKQPKGESHGSV